MLETWVRSLGWKDPLEKGLAYRFQYSCLENPMDRGVWEAIVHGVAQSQTQLKQLSMDARQVVTYCGKLVCVCVCVCWSPSRIRLSVVPWNVAHQAPRSMGFSRQEY